VTTVKIDRRKLCLVSHNVDKFLLVNLAVLVEIKLVNHRLSVDKRALIRKKEKKNKDADAQLVLLEAVANLFSYAPEIAYGDLARIVIVEQLESTPYLVHRIARQYPFRHCELNSSSTFLHTRKRTH
jgi:hypothetical protein